MSASSCSFILTKRAASQGRNMHIFALTDNPIATIAGGLNLNRFSLQAKTFYRWFHLCNDWLNSPPYALDPTIVLRPITVQRIDVMVYGVGSVDGPAIPRDSLELIKPGCYGIFSGDGTPYKGNVNCIQLFRYNFEEEIEACRHYADSPDEVTQQNEISSELRALAMARDEGHCFVTGRADEETVLVWIVPPAVAFRRSNMNETTLTMHLHVDNIVTVSSNLTFFFKRNAFTVDLEDAARVIQFEDLPDALPSHCPVLLPSASEPFWRSHLKHTLSAFLPAGRANYDQEGYQARKLMKELVDDEDAVKLGDAKWETPVGAEVFGVYMERVKKSDDDNDTEYS
uniref:HNH nuclease domain-containing protein n=1 Tax=Mycena chlorophos TaxID=658473 RepID=A0ABQ0LGS2_MYCCL|nr:predicted protein [Mycena chlorophos]